MAIIGAILGDIAGSIYEFGVPRDIDISKEPLFTKRNFFTDDSIMTLATKYAIREHISFGDAYREYVHKYPRLSYGENFKTWAHHPELGPYNSYGNGAAMRCSYIGEHFLTEKEVEEWATKSAECTHNHPEGIKGAVTTAQCIYMARNGASKREMFYYAIRQYPKNDYKYGVEFPLNSYRNEYEWNETCMGSVPVAIRCFLESEDYESFLRNAFSIRCDLDTVCAIGGGIAEEFYHGTGFDNEKLLKAYLTEDLLSQIE